jgi:hypothetical protein
VCSLLAWERALQTPGLYPLRRQLGLFQFVVPSTLPLSFPSQSLSPVRLNKALRKPKQGEEKVEATKFQKEEYKYKTL